MSRSSAIQEVEGQNSGCLMTVRDEAVLTSIIGAVADLS